MLQGALYSYRVRPWRFDVEGGAPLTVDLEIGSPIASPTAVSARGKSRSSVEITWKGRIPRNAKVQVTAFRFGYCDLGDRWRSGCQQQEVY